MAKVDQTIPQDNPSAAKSEHSEAITSQVLEKTGRPPDLHHVEVCQHHNGNYRVNVWEKLASDSESAYSTEIHIAASYYLKVADSGEISYSNPPLTKRRFSA